LVLLTLGIMLGPLGSYVGTLLAYILKIFNTCENKNILGCALSTWVDCELMWNYMWSVLNETIYNL